LSENHTLNYFRKECYFPKILDRTNYAGWEKLGRKTIDVRLKEKADEIIKAHKPEPIDGSVQKLIDKILKEVDVNK